MAWFAITRHGTPVVSVELTPTDGTSTGTLVSDQVAVVAAGPTTYASDPFSWTVVNSWGSASTGGAWTLSGTAADFDVTGTSGTVALPAPRAHRAAFLNAASAADVDLSLRVATNKVATGGAQYIFSAVRRVSPGNFYRITLRIAPNGRVYVGASTVINNAETGIGTDVQVAGLTHSPGAFIRLRAQLSGASPTTIRVRAWADGVAEPSTWQYSATNSVAALQAAGGLGLESYLAAPTTNAPVIVTFDDYLVTSVP